MCQTSHDGRSERDGFLGGTSPRGGVGDGFAAASTAAGHDFTRIFECVVILNTRTGTNPLLLEGANE